MRSMNGLSPKPGSRRDWSSSDSNLAALQAKVGRDGFLAAALVAGLVAVEAAEDASLDDADDLLEALGEGIYVPSSRLVSWSFCCCCYWCLCLCCRLGLVVARLDLLFVVRDMSLGLGLGLGLCIWSQR